MLPLLLLVALAGCAPSWYRYDADREVQLLLEEYEETVLGDREQWVQHPEPAPDEAPAPTQDQEPPPGQAPAERMVIDLPGALELAFRSSRDFQTQEESLYLAGLGYSLTRYNFGPILNSTIAYLWSDAEGVAADDVLRADLGVGQILPTGGRLDLGADLTSRREDGPSPFALDGDASYDSSLRVNLRQPLLRGAGYEVSHEALTQGERDLIYAVRDFELFRQDFCIRVAAAFYDLVSQKTQLDNDERNYQDRVFDTKKTEALRELERARHDDVILARRREVEAEDALLVSQTNYKLAVDDFKILVGLPTATDLEIVDDAPVFEPVRLAAESAVAVALNNRLDLHTSRDRVDDSERRVRLARDGLLPDFDLTADYASAGVGDDLSRAAPDRWSGSIGLSLELPLDRKSERNVYRASLISLERTRRNLDRERDEVERDVLNRLRELGQVETRIQIQTDQIAEEERAVAVIRIEFESGDVDARALLDAQQSLTDARNSLIELRVEHFITRLRLRRDLGLLFVDEKGMWRL